MNVTETLITEVASSLYERAMINIPRDVRDGLKKAYNQETAPRSRMALRTILDTIRCSGKEHLPVCQDNGVSTYFIKLGTEMKIEGNLNTGLAKGARKASKDMPLRPNICHSLTREINMSNIGMYVPVVHLELLPGKDWMEITMVPKGFGSENMSRLQMLIPGVGIKGIKEFVLNAVVESGSKPCPPYILGVGTGGTSEIAALLAKKAAVLSPVGKQNTDKRIARIEQELLLAINATGIGPLGFGGKTTALDVHIEAAHTHIGGNPVAINFQCWPGRRATAKIYSNGQIKYLNEEECNEDYPSKNALV